MQTLQFNFTRPDPIILCLGAHCDDIEIGCCGSLLKLVAAYPKLSMHFIVFSGTAARVAETNEAALKIGGSNVDIAMHILDFRDGFLPYEGARPKDSLIEISKDLRPDLIFTHYGRDRHQDHRIVSEITWNIFRDNLILEYEIPKYDGDLGNPNLYCEMSSEQLGKKIEILETCFVSQASKHWFNDETFRSLARIRGLESGANGSYAEAFYLNKGVFRI